MSNYKTKLSSVKAFAFDVDGVFTDGTVLCTETGDLLRMHNAKDGYALRVAILKGYPVAIITGGSSESIIKRFEPIGVNDIFLKSHYKIPDFESFCKKYDLKPEEVLYMGDDIPDYHVMQLVGLPTCPQDACPEIKAISKYISHKNGGQGAVRDVIEQVMKVQGKWMESFDGKHD